MGKKIFLIVLLIVFVVVGANIWTWNINTIPTIIIFFICLGAINVLWGEIRNKGSSTESNVEHDSKTKLGWPKIIGLTVLASVICLLYLVPFLLRKEVDRGIKKIEAREGQNIETVLSTRLDEFQKLKQEVENRGLRQIIEKQENKPLEEIPIYRIKEILAGS